MEASGLSHELLLSSDSDKEGGAAPAAAGGVQ